MKESDKINITNNRLRLNFALETQLQRNKFITQYIQQPQFNSNPLTSDQCQTISNYILWGKNQAGLNGSQTRQYDLKTHYSQTEQPVQQSLDVLIDTPSFNQAELLMLNKIKTKRQHFKFNREEQIKRAGAATPILNNLFRDIDITQAQIALYDKKEFPEWRPELQQRILQANIDVEELKSEVAQWSYHTYLKKKRLLVDLRRQQYVIKDSYAPTSNQHQSTYYISPFTQADFQAGINVFPLGLKFDSGINRLVFKEFKNLIPENFGEEQHKQINKYYWHYRDLEKQNNKNQHRQMNFDFRNGFHIQRLIETIAEIGNAPDQDQHNGTNTLNLIETFWYYVREAELDEILEYILKAKIRHQKNQQIMEHLNKNFGKSYTVNYISTIYCQRLIKKLTDTAQKHEQLIENLWAPQNWKKCTRCGRTILKNGDNFVKRKRSSDGFSSRCKQCEHDIREEKKEKR